MVDLVLNEKLIKAPALCKSGKVHRVVPKEIYENSDPRFLTYTSGELNRCNPPGVECLYVADSGETASAEFATYGDISEGYHYLSLIRARLVLDLTTSSSWSIFDLEERDFFAPFRRRAKRENLPLHRIGSAIANRNFYSLDKNEDQIPVVGIMYPSNAMNQQGKSGVNIALFKKAFEDPDSLDPMRQPDHLSPTAYDRWP